MNKKVSTQSAQLHHLLSASNASLVTSMLLAATLAYMQREVSGTFAVSAWLSAMMLVVLARAALVYAQRRSTVVAEDATRIWLFRFRLGVVAAGAVWGAAGMLLFPAHHPQHEMFLIFMLAGVTVGGVISYSADLFSAVVFSVLVILPVSVSLFLAGGELFVAMGMAVLLYLAFMIMSQRIINRNIRENISLHLEASAREEMVRASEERYRLLLSHLPVGVFHYDTNLVITYCNSLFAEMLRNPVERMVGLDMKLLRDQDIMPALRGALEGEMGYYEGRYLATFSDADVWIAMTCTPFRDGDGNIAGGIAIVQDISERKVADEKIRKMAFYDPLTKLPNRRVLLDRLQQAMAAGARSGKIGALLFIDLDNFKTLNDTLGHDMGDMLLQQVAQRLNSCARDGDTVARLGGDEFVMMLEDLDTQAVEAAALAEAVGEKILAELGRPYRLGVHEYHNTPSIGAALFNGHKLEKEALLKQADIAMYQAKKAGRNTLRFFDQKMQDAVSARITLENELRVALEQGQFQLYYQVQVDSSRHPVGAEALIRWLHPKRGLVSPSQFILVAEESDLILRIGQWVLETACKQIGEWQRNILTRDLVLAVNVSAKQFRQTDFVERVQEIVRRHAINPRLLKLELTESMLLDSVEDTIATMRSLKSIGIQFSLDDFGTGYSSLQYLKRLPLDQIKIDRSFVHDIATDSNDREIVGTIIAMAQNLYLGVIAEGVETEVQNQFLLGNGCKLYQGNLFGQPMPVEQFEAALKPD